MLKYTNEKIVDVDDWDELVSTTYGKVYSFQQQEGCKDRGIFTLDVPSKDTYDAEMNETIEELVNSEEMGVKFQQWLARDPKQAIGEETEQWMIDLWWERNFYPDIHTIANDLHSKGLLEAGKYIINIDW